MSEVLGRLASWSSPSWPGEPHRALGISSVEPPGLVPRHGLLGASPSTSCESHRPRSWRRGSRRGLDQGSHRSSLVPRLVVSLRRESGARSNCEDFADGLDSELLTVLIDVVDHHLCGRSSSAAKKAEALFKIALARRSSLFSCSSSEMRCLSAVVTPPMIPSSISAWATQAFTLSVPYPS